MSRAIVVGGSLAGVFAAQALRRSGFEDEIVMVGDEPHLPYDRPPLSKNYLTDEEVDETKLTLRPVTDPDALGLTWELGRRAAGVDVEAGRLTLDDDRVLAFDGMVVATGARPRRIPSVDHELSGVYELRGLDDARAIRAAIDGGLRHLVVCGAGFIGAEVAASARARGVEVTLVDAAAAPMDRVLDTEAGLAVADLHRGNGVDVRLAAGVTATTGQDGVLAGVELSDGSSIDTQAMVVGVGVVPNTEWLEGSSVEVADGVVLDGFCAIPAGTAADRPMVGAGDVARWSNARFGRSMRVEQWDNAVEMGLYTGRRLAGLLAGDDPPAERFEPVPWFWSDQYDRKMHLAGLAEGEPRMLQGSFEEQRFVRMYVGDDDAVMGVFCWNRPRQAIMARQLIAAGGSVDEAVEKLSG